MNIGDRIVVTKPTSADVNRKGYVLLWLPNAAEDALCWMDPFTRADGTKVAEGWKRCAVIDIALADVQAPPPVDPPPPPPPVTGAFSSRDGVLPAASWRPFSAVSPWNLPASGAKLHPRSAAIMANVLRNAPKGVANVVAGLSGLSRTPRPSGSTADYGHPVYFADERDPLVTIRGTSNATNIAAGTQIRIPKDAVPANGSDAHMCIVQGTVVHDLWAAKWIDATHLEFKIGKRIALDGDGLKSAATATHFALLAGIVRPEELFGGHIPHALFCVLAKCSGELDFGYGVTKPVGGGASYVYPANHGEDKTIEPGPDRAPAGMRMVLGYTDSEITALSMPEWKKTLLRCMAEYGLYVGDGGGPGMGIQFISGATYTAFGRPDPFVEYAKANGMRAGTDAWANTYVFDIGLGVDWSRLKVLEPPAAS